MKSHPRENNESTKAYNKRIDIELYNIDENDPDTMTDMIRDAKGAIIIVNMGNSLYKLRF